MPVPQRFNLGSRLLDDNVEAGRGEAVAVRAPARVVFVGELPRTASGKIQRFRLREAGRRPERRLP